MGNIDRRLFLRGAAAMAGAGLLSRSSPALARGAASDGPRAVFFDAFPVFDPRSIGRAVHAAFPERADAIASAWFGKVFAYTWIRTAAGQYIQFDEVVRDALRFVTREAKVEMSAGTERDLVASWSELDAWPDVNDALDRLRTRGVRLAFLSNMTEGMLRANARRNGIEGIFDEYLSTDRVRAYKPAKLAYAMGPEVLGTPPDRSAFVAFANWDAQGAAWFGYRTIWVNRLNQPREMMGDEPVETFGDLSESVRTLLGV